MGPVEAVMTAMRDSHGVLSVREARRLGMSAGVEARLVREGVVERPAPGVLAAVAAPLTWHRAVRVATLAAGGGVASHGTAARLHRLDGFAEHSVVEVMTAKGARTRALPDVVTRSTRGLTEADVVTVDACPALGVATTLALLAPGVGSDLVWSAVRSALRAGHSELELRAVAERWRQRGRPGPAALLLVLDELAGHRLPDRWVRSLAGEIRHRSGVRITVDHPVLDERGGLVEVLALAAPTYRVGVVHREPTPEADERRAALRRRGWSVVGIGWCDRHRITVVASQVVALLRHCGADRR